MAQRKIRQSDIAREAGVSVATVDRVLNTRPGVNIYTAQRIWDALDRLERQRGRAAAGSHGPLRFDFILPAGPNTFMAMLEDAITEIGRSVAGDDVTIQCHRVQGFNAQILADCIRDVGGKSSGLAVVALENPAVREAVNGIADAGVPVVTLVSNLTTPKKTGYVGLDNRAAGRTAGFLMGRFLDRETGQVAVVEGSLALSYRDHQERELGFRDSLREYASGIEIVGRWETQDDFEKSYRQTIRMLDAYPELLGLYSIGSGVRGIAHALEERGVAHDVVFIGHDLTRFTRKFLVDGTLDAVIDQNPRGQVKLAVDTLLAHHKGGDFKPPAPLRVEVFFRENLP